MSKPTISMCMIAKDEAKNVERCFASFWDDVDEIVLVDTGSSDDTVEIAKAFAEKRGDKWVETLYKDEGTPNPTNNPKLVIGHFEWCDDFAAARNYADGFATSEWRTWCDLDDEVIGIPHLRELAEAAAPDVSQFYALYEYALDDNNNCFCELWRERLVRADAGTSWVGVVHECQFGPGQITQVAREKARWVHHRAGTEIRDRNELLLRKWLETEPDNPRALAYLGTELMGSRKIDEQDQNVPDAEKMAESVIYFRRYLEIPGQAPDARAQATRRLAQVFMSVGDFKSAQDATLPAFAECPWWPDTLLTLAEIAHEQQDWQRTIDFSNQVLQRGQPQTLLIVNPEDYSLKPRVLIASAMAALGDLENACKTAQQIVDVNPGYMGMRDKLAEWLGALAREQAGQQWGNLAQLLVMNDEPEKAIVLLQTVPFFAADHPAVTAARVMTANALSEPYAVEKVVDSPRGRLLARCLREQQVLLEEPVEDEALAA